jgi:UDP-glucose 4-epimerase
MFTGQEQIMVVAVTGGSGRVGQHLIDELLTHGYEVRNLDRTPPATHRVPFFQVDTMDLGQICNVARGCSGIVHLAAIAGPYGWPSSVVYTNNTVSNHNILEAAVTVGIDRVCMASSVNAIGMGFSRMPRYDYFPIDERHPTYNEDCYSLSKWIGEQQADSFARRYESMTLSSFRFHGVIVPGSYPAWRQGRPFNDARDLSLWGYTDVRDAARACRLALEADFRGHEAFFIIAADTARTDTPSLELARRFFPDVPVTGDLSGHASFFSSHRAERLLGWKHEHSWRTDD